jgi:hypothetical protein
MTSNLIIELPDPPSREVVLDPNVALNRGGSVPGEFREPLHGRLSMGGPVVRRISVDSTDDVELRRFLERDAGDSDFYLLRLTCTLRSADDEPFTEVLLGVALSAEDVLLEAPIAWSMEPERLVDAVEVSRSVRLGPSLKILGLGLDGNVEIGGKRERHDVFLEALYELESTPTWAMYRTASTSLQGLHRFHLVVKATKGSITVGEVAATAKIEKKRFGILGYEAALPDTPVPISFVLPTLGEHRASDA